MSKEKLTYSKESEKASHRGCHIQNFTTEVSFGKKEEKIKAELMGQYLIRL